MAVTDAVTSRLLAVRTRIADACARAGRDASEVRLVAVSKFHSTDAMREAYAAGQREFGESYAQELVEKADLLRDLPDLRLRFIGGLQTNKAKLLVQSGCSIDSLASESGAKAISKKAEELGRVVSVLIQVNVAQEAQKRGVDVAALPELIGTVRALPGLRLEGLMTIPPADDLDAARTCFRSLRLLAQDQGLTTLSMGMSDDLEVAIEEGSTMVRVGTAIFGPRG